MAESSYRFDAFLSYATAADYALARELESFLESFHELPTPDDIPLKRLEVWRDGSDVSRTEIAGSPDVEGVLTSYLQQCRYLVLLWSTKSLQSQWMRFELAWFLENRGEEHVLLAITDAADPEGMHAELFVPEILRSGLHRKRWYDFRGFDPARAATAAKIRDFDEARIQLAADLNGESPARIQPIWWRNKVAEQQKRADEEARARRRVEVAECDARVEAARGWYERAFTYFERRRYRDCSKCLLNALAVASRSGIPDHYPTSAAHPGWAADAWAFLRYALALTPRRISTLPAPSAIAVGPDNALHPDLSWIDGGTSIAVASPDRIDLIDSRDPGRRSSISVPSEAGPITAWAGATDCDTVFVGTERGWLLCRNDGVDYTYRADAGAPINAIALARGGAGAAVATSSGAIILWTLTKSGPPSLARVLERTPVFSLWFVRDETALLLRSGKALTVLPLNGDPETTVMSRPGSTVAVSAGGSTVAWSEWDVVTRFDVEKPDDSTLYVGGHHAIVRGVVFGAGDERLLTRDMEGNVCAWLGRDKPLERGMTRDEVITTQSYGRSNRGELLKHLEGIGSVDSVAAHPLDAARILVRRHDPTDRSDSVIEEWDLGFSFQPAAGYQSLRRSVSRASWLPDGTGVVAGSDNGEVRIFTIAPKPSERLFVSLGMSLGDVVVSEDGQLVVTASQDGVVAVRRLDDGSVIAQENLPTLPYTLEFVNGDTIAIGCGDGTVRFWAWKTKRPSWRFGVGGIDPMMSLAATRDGELLAGSSPKRITVWRVSDEAELWSTEAFLRSFGVAVSGDGHIAASAGMDGRVRTYELLTGNVISDIRLPGSVAGKPEQVTAIAISDDNRTAFAGLWDGMVCVVDLLAGRELFRFAAHTKVLSSIQQSPASGMIVTSSIDTDPANERVRIWDLIDLGFVLIQPLANGNWTSEVDAAFSERHGAGDPELAAELRAFAPANTATTENADDHRLPDPRLQLMDSLRADPRSPQSNYDVALACLTAGEKEKARHYAARAYRLGGEGLIREPAAQYLIGLEELEAGARDRAMEWFHRAAGQNDPDALLQLGLAALKGRSDEAAGVEFLERSARLGNAAAAYHLGAYFEHTRRGVMSRTKWRQIAFADVSTTKPSADLTIAFECYSQAAGMGFAPAQVRMGDFYAEGVIVPRDVELARSWYDKAIRQQSTEATLKLSALNDAAEGEETNVRP